MKNHYRINIKELSVHLLFWMLYVASEYFANLVHMHPEKSLRFFQSTFLSLPALMLATYFIAGYVVPRYLKTSKWPLFVFWILVVAAFVFFARIKWAELVNYIESDRYFKMPVDKMLKNIIRDYSIIALAVCIYIIGDYRKKQQLNEQLIKAKAEAEIKLLKGQLHPHFLFNSLNNIYSLALMKSNLTADSILKLTELLDYLVYRANMDKVALSKEVDLLQNYVDLEELRYGEKLKIESEIAVGNPAVKVAPLILLPFAENCFKHGGVGQEGLFRIQIRLLADQKKLVFHLTNSKKRGKDKTEVNGGVGLENIRKRLTLLYPDRHQLSIDNQPDHYSVRLEINFRDEDL
ncbi:MAG: histidine kinase [Saprospiraceae bacterium]|nr:histidine kinase [Saprospiraceae bacterium]MDZ4703095.1 histidine kinase [Saprospiraceae bacterium]